MIVSNIPEATGIYKILIHLLFALLAESIALFLPLFHKSYSLNRKTLEDPWVPSTPL